MGPYRVNGGIRRSGSQRQEGKSFNFDVYGDWGVGNTFGTIREVDLFIAS